MCEIKLLIFELLEATFERPSMAVVSGEAISQLIVFMINSKWKALSL